MVGRDEDDGEELEGLFGGVEGSGVGGWLSGEGGGGVCGGEGVDEGLRGVDGVWRRAGEGGLGAREEGKDGVDEREEGVAEAVEEGEGVEDDLEGEWGVAREVRGGERDAGGGGETPVWRGAVRGGGSGRGGGGGLCGEGFGYWIWTLAVEELCYGDLEEVRGRRWRVREGATSRFHCER